MSEELEKLELENNELELENKKLKAALKKSEKAKSKPVEPCQKHANSNCKNPICVKIPKLSEARKARGVNK